jgi:hypothetical protein
MPSIQLSAVSRFLAVRLKLCCVYTMQVCSRESSPGDARAEVSCKLWKFDRLDFGARCDSHYSIYMKRLRAHPQHWTHASQLASCKRGWQREWIESFHAAGSRYREVTSHSRALNDYIRSSDLSMKSTITMLQNNRPVITTVHLQIAWILRKV